MGLLSTGFLEDRPRSLDTEQHRKYEQKTLLPVVAV